MNENELKRLAASLVKLFAAEKRTISVAESCTGGWISKLITDISGASAVFPGGICTYSNEAKIKFLGVKPETLKEYGAVSEPTAREMAEGVKNAFGTSCGVAVTGIAGPLSDNTSKPVGLIYVAVSDENGTRVTELNNSFSGDVREQNRFSAVKTALETAGVRYEKQKTE